MQSIFFKFLVDCPNGLIELTEKSFNTVVIVAERGMYIVKGL